MTRSSLISAHSFSTIRILTIRLVSCVIVLELLLLGFWVIVEDEAIAVGTCLIIVLRLSLAFFAAITTAFAAFVVRVAVWW